MIPARFQRFVSWTFYHLLRHLLLSFYYHLLLYSTFLEIQMGIQRRYSTVYYTTPFIAWGVVPTLVILL